MLSQSKSLDKISPFTYNYPLHTTPPHDSDFGGSMFLPVIFFNRSK